MSNVEFTTIGTTDIKVSQICLGTWAIGGWMWGGADDKNAVRTIHAALDQGVNFLDTAPVYGFGHSEEVVGQAIEEYGKRSEIVLATKVALEWSDEGKVVRNSSKERIEKELDDSLRRLRTDYIDLYQVHWPDPLVPFEETATALEKLLNAGKVRSIGVSNYDPQQMTEFKKYCPLHAVQSPYNLFERAIDTDVLPYAQENDLSILAYGAICRGLLSGAMSQEREFTGDDLRKHDPKFKLPRFRQYLDAVDALNTLAKENYDKDVLALAIRWVIDRGCVALWGARKPEQLAHLESAFGWSISTDDMQAIDDILKTSVTDPIGPEFMAPPSRS